MQVSELIQQTGGLAAMARELGVDERQARTGAEALLPGILGRFKQHAEAQPGGGGLLGMLGKLGGGGLMDEVLGPQPTNLEHGNQVLGQIFGSKDVSRTVARDAAGQTGVDPNVLKKMLPTLSMLVAGYMSNQGGAPAQPAQGSAGGIAAVLDMDGDGNPLNDLAGMFGKLKR
ncbi:MAG: DUF937 domain-containing protein [Gammaproteobacteria bacterium]